MSFIHREHIEELKTEIDNFEKVLDIYEEQLGKDLRKLHDELLLIAQAIPDNQPDLYSRLYIAIEAVDWEPWITDEFKEYWDERSKNRTRILRQKRQ